MNQFNSSSVEITFTFVNPIETIKLFHNDEQCMPDSNNQYIYRAQHIFPVRLQFEMNGKCPRGSDCRVDANGEVIWDRYIIVSEVKVDGVVPNLDYLKRWGRIHPNTTLKDFRPANQIVFSNYMGFNGVIELEFDGSDVLEWLMRTHQYKEDDWQKNYGYD